MKRAALYFLLILFVSGAFFYLRPVEKKKSHYPITEKKSFVIIIPSYNNSDYVEKNLRSVFSQKYDNFRVIYIDDNSRDDTFKKASELLRELDVNQKTSLIHNTENSGSLSNIYNAAHSCEDHEIVVLLDGDDFLAHDNVLNTLNEAYADPSVWLTYGNYLDYPSFKQEPHICKKLSSKVIKKSLFRQSPWVTSHLRTFYASLFKQIQLKDLLYRGKFYSMSGDLAFMFPLLELGKNHIRFIDETLYLYNRQNPINDHKININFQQQCANHIRLQTKYPPLKNLPSQYVKGGKTADLVVFSEDSPLQLYAFLESIERYVSGLNRVSVLYHSSSPTYEKSYSELKEAFQTVQFLEIDNDFEPLLTRLIFHSTAPKSNHILFATDHLIIQDIIDLSKGIDLIDRTGAYGLFYGHHENLTYSSELCRFQPLPPQNPLRGLSPTGEVPLAWQFFAGNDDWNTPNSFFFTLFRKETLKKSFKSFKFDSPSQLLVTWKKNYPDEAVGLFYKKRKCGKIASLEKCSSTDLIEKFNDGYKIDITPYFQLSSPSQEITGRTSFISRD